MNYEEFYLEEHDITIEIGVIPTDDIKKFLSKFDAKDGVVSKDIYESFMFRHLIKKYADIEKAIKKLAKAEQNIVHYKILELIFDLNPRLNASEIVLIDNNLLYVADAIQQYKQSSPRLSTTPGWFSSAKSSQMVNPTYISTLVENIWDTLKKSDPYRDYRRQKVDILNIELPVLDIGGVPAANLMLKEFIMNRFNGDIVTAKSAQPVWLAHVLICTIPHFEEIKKALIDGNYLEVYSQSVILTQMYVAVIQINPELTWESLDWAPFNTTETSERQPGKKKQAKVINKKNPGKKTGASTKEELEAERLHFNQLDFNLVLKLPEKIKVAIIGQDEAVDTLCDSIAVARVGLRGDNKPVGSFLLAGPTGVGKTELAKVLAQNLTNNKLIRIDCSEYQSSHEIAKLFGAPPGYVGFEDNDPRLGGHIPPSTLASKIKADPFSIVLFDEIEKAHEAIYNVLLQIMDEGHMTNGRGETCNFNEAVILLTSNIGSKEADREAKKGDLGFCEVVIDRGKIKKEVIDKCLEDKFPPEFRNRLTEVLHFNTLDEGICEHIVEVILQRTAGYLKKSQNMDLKWDKDVLAHLVSKGYSFEFGARNLERTVQKIVELPLAKNILKNKYIPKAVQTALEETKFSEAFVELSEDNIPAKVVGFEPALGKETTITISVEEDKIKFSNSE